MKPDISNIYDVMAFIELIADEIQDGNPFEEFSKNSRYTKDEAALRSRLMDDCIDVCNKQHLNLKCLMLVLFNEALTGTEVICPSIS